MKRFVLCAVLAIAIAAAVAFVWTKMPEPPDLASDAPNSGPVSAVSGPEKGPEDSSSGEIDEGPSATSWQPDNVRTPTQRDRTTVVDPGSEEFELGSSNEDLRWMRRRGWPTDSDEMSRYSATSDAELAARAANDELAAYERCYRQLHRDSMGPAALECFEDLAARGSHYAMQALAYAHLGVGAEGIVVDRLLAEAWFRVMYRLGDWTALLTAHRLNASEPMHPNELLLADALAAQIIDDLNRRHLAWAGEPLPIEPRPGYEQAIERILQRGLDNPGEQPRDP